MVANRFGRCLRFERRQNTRLLQCLLTRTSWQIVSILSLGVNNPSFDTKAKPTRAKIGPDSRLPNIKRLAASFLNCAARLSDDPLNSRDRSRWKGLNPLDKHDLKEMLLVIVDVSRALSSRLPKCCENLKFPFPGRLDFQRNCKPRSHWRPLSTACDKMEGWKPPSTLAACARRGAKTLLKAFTLIMSNAFHSTNEMNN